MVSAVHVHSTTAFSTTWLGPGATRMHPRGCTLRAGGCICWAYMELCLRSEALRFACSIISADIMMMQWGGRVQHVRKGSLQDSRVGTFR